MKSTQSQNEDSMFGTWNIMDDDDLANDPRPAISKLEAAPVNTPLQQNKISLRTENSTRPRSSPDSETNLPKAIPVEKSPRYNTEYEKIAKKGEPKLVSLINDILGRLRTNPGLGKRLTENLRGERSIALLPYDYRIIYKIQRSPSPVIVVRSIGHRSHVYDDRARYSASQKNIPT